MNQLKQGAWLAAVSGGADSMAMLDLCRRSGVRLHVAHVNYHNRESAMRDQRLCEEYCSRYAIPLHCLYAQNRPADNFQAEARRERYAFFAALCSEHSLSGVIVAHQQDDVLETYVMQKQRGSIPQHYGLQAETVLHGVRVIRPLLDQPRAALREYCETNGILFGDDESNASDDYQRNRVRHHVIEPMTASQRQALLQQIEADNALLRELRGQVKKLAQAVKNTIPALAEAMENLRKNLLLFCYQLGYLRKGKERLNTSLNTLRPALTQYNQLAKDIRDKTKERRSLLSEKKALSAVHVFRHRELAAKIAVLTEDLEELRSEKNLLLASLAYTEEDAADKFPKDIAAMEQSLKRLEEQEQKYSAELDAALNEYAGLREQAQSVNPVQLYEARQAIRPGKEQEAENRAQEVYGEKYNPLLMFDSKKAVSRMLHEDMERQAVRRIVRQAQKGQQIFQNKKSEQER